MTQPGAPPDLAVLRQSIQQDPLGARAQIDALLAHEPDNIALIEARILTLLRCNDMAEVVEAARRALLRHRTLNLHFWLGGALLHLGRAREALAPLGEAVGISANAATLDTLARCQHRLGMIDAAIATLRHAISLPMGDVTPFYASLRGLAYALRDAGRWLESELVIQDLLTRFTAQSARVASMALHFDITHPYPGWNRFLDKAGLAEAFAAFHARRPDDPVFWPATFRLPQEYATLVQWRAANPSAILAIKPNDLFGGHGITITRALPPVDSSGCVAQRYVDPPALIEGHKFHIRLYILITSAAPARAWLWGEGIVRLALSPTPPMMRRWRGRRRTSPTPPCMWGTRRCMLPMTPTPKMSAMSAPSVPSCVGSIRSRRRARRHGRICAHWRAASSPAWRSPACSRHRRASIRAGASRPCCSRWTCWSIETTAPGCWKCSATPR
ncbi:MAG: hypothetical protein WB509_01905 [Acetobacteraceae bacterium]